VRSFCNGKRFERPIRRGEWRELAALILSL
jgi:hypothetical protein